MNKQSLKDKKRELIVDYCLKITHLWLENTDKTLSWVLMELEKQEEVKKKKL